MTNLRNVDREISIEGAFEMGFTQGIRSFKTRLKDFMDAMWIEDAEECRLRMAHFLEDRIDGKEDI